VGEIIGKPPGIVHRFGDAGRGVGEEGSQSAEVGRRVDADVKAMESAVEIDECLAESMRLNNRRCVYASTMAMLLGMVSGVGWAGEEGGVHWHADFGGVDFGGFEGYGCAALC
jgi:hypothetical protein